jgi:hypothetical protein
MRRSTEPAPIMPLAIPLISAIITITKSGAATHSTERTFFLKGILNKVS